MTLAWIVLFIGVVLSMPALYLASYVIYQLRGGKRSVTNPEIERLVDGIMRLPRADQIELEKLLDRRIDELKGKGQ